MAILDLVDELIYRHQQNSSDPKIEELLDDLSSYALKGTIIMTLLPSDLEDSPSIFSWASESELLSDRLKMPQSVFEVLNSSDSWPFVRSSVNAVTVPKEIDGSWYVELKADEEELEDEELSSVEIMLGFGKSGTKWKMDLFQINLGTSFFM